MNGKGLLKLDNNFIYEGNFKNGLRHGEGILKSSLNNYLYKGDWRHGFKHGFGIF